MLRVVGYKVLHSKWMPRDRGKVSIRSGLGNFAGFVSSHARWCSWSLSCGSAVRRILWF